MINHHIIMNSGGSCDFEDILQYIHIENSCFKLLYFKILPVLQIFDFMVNRRDFKNFL